MGSTGPFSEPVDFQRNLRLAEAMYELARECGALDRIDHVEKLLAKIRMARMLNRLPMTADDEAQIRRDIVQMTSR
jgi:hypothetical protein